MGELPSNFEFGEYLSHTFPGFFTAVTFFMLLDIWSSQNLTAWAIKDISGLISFTAFILLAGTIFGVILDGIRHSLMENVVFIKTPEFKKIDNLKYMVPGDKLQLSNYYFFKLMGEKPIDAQCAFDILIKNVYRYVEFYGNTSISLIMFSLVVPFYLYQVLYVPWSHAFLLAILSMIIAGICLYGSYDALKAYRVDRISQICGYLDQKVQLEVKKSDKTDKESNPASNFEYHIAAKIVDKKCLNQVVKEEIIIYFRVYKNNSEEIHKKETISDGKATYELSLTNGEKAEVIVSSENCIPAAVILPENNYGKRVS